VTAPEPVYEWWCQRLVAQFTAQPFMEEHIARERAATLEAETARVERLEAEAQRLRRVLHATRRGVRLPWMNAYPVP
jgi:hypothetical protein